MIKSFARRPSARPRPARATSRAESEKRRFFRASASADTRVDGASGNEAVSRTPVGAPSTGEAAVSRRVAGPAPSGAVDRNRGGATGLSETGGSRRVDGPATIGQARDAAVPRYSVGARTMPSGPARRIDDPIQPAVPSVRARRAAQQRRRAESVRMRRATARAAFPTCAPRPGRAHLTPVAWRCRARRRRRQAGTGTEATHRGRPNRPARGKPDRPVASDTRWSASPRRNRARAHPRLLPRRRAAAAAPHPRRRPHQAAAVSPRLAEEGGAGSRL